MRARYVVDTNVLIAASAADPANPRDIDATPDDPALRMAVWQWLSEFQQGGARMVLDGAQKIFEEYQNKLGFNDFGRQVVIQKWSTDAVDYVEVVYDDDGHGVLPQRLDAVVHDNADKKIVAAALASKDKFGEGCIAFAGDTDWHDWERALQAQGVLLEPIIEEWSRQKHAQKRQRRR